MTASDRWSIQFGLTLRDGRDGHAYLACDYEPYSLELALRRCPATTTPAGSWRAASASTTRPRTSTVSAWSTSAATAGFTSATPTATASSCCRSRRSDDPRPPIARSTTTLPGFHPRKLGHVNFLTGELARDDRVLLRRARDARHRPARRRGHLAARQRRPPRDGAGRQGLRAHPPSGVRAGRLGRAAGRARPPRPARPLAGVGPGAPRPRPQPGRVRADPRGGVLRRAVQ